MLITDINILIPVLERDTKVHEEVQISLTGTLIKFELAEGKKKEKKNEEGTIVSFSSTKTHKKMMLSVFSLFQTLMNCFIAANDKHLTRYQLHHDDYFSVIYFSFMLLKN